jgi:hypothetical protein
MKFWIIVLFVTVGFIGTAQEVNVDGSLYSVKGKTILMNGEDVTPKLSVEKQQEIMSAIGVKKTEIERIKKEEEKAKKSKKDIEKAEKNQKKAEKELKKHQKAQSNFEKAGKKHDVAIKKYEKLKKKGKLSPEDEGKWLKKIEKLKVSHEKAKKKLK